MNDVRIRLATKRDLEEICGIENDTFSDPYPRALLNKLLRDHAKDFLVAEVSSGKMVGYCVCSRDGNLAHLISIAVLGEYRRRGVGTMLIECLLLRLEGTVAEIWLEVNTGNKAAIKFYERFGFGKIMIIENYYGDGSAALKMQMPLGERRRQTPDQRQSR
jgi:ribosomal-protein-alanine N-acetyltransferase